MKIDARIEIIELKEKPIFKFEVETESIEAEVARLREHLNPNKNYKIVVTPNIPDIDIGRLKFISTVAPIFPGRMRRSELVLGRDES